MTLRSLGAPGRSFCSDDDRAMEAAANEKLRELGSPCRLASVYSKRNDTGTHILAHGVAFRGSPSVIEQAGPFSVDELVKAAQTHGTAIAEKKKAQWTGEAGHLPKTTWPSPQEIADAKE